MTSGDRRGEEREAIYLLILTASLQVLRHCRIVGLCVLFCLSIMEDSLINLSAGPCTVHHWKTTNVNIKEFLKNQNLSV